VAGLGSQPAWLGPLAVLGCIGAASTYVLTNNPTDGQPDLLRPCLFKTLTGLDCPGCGGTRMVWYLLNGDVYQAARHHIVALIAVPVLLYAFVLWSVNRLTGRTIPIWHPSGQLLGLYGLAWLAFSVLRDLPWEPFHSLLV
jgi:hypothetical protein